MKKLLIILLCLVICTVSVCCAESEEAFEFVFRNGIKWGDAPHNISSSEPSSGDRRTYNNFALLEYSDVNVSKYTADLSYGFIDDALAFCLYILNPEETDYMTGALSEKYGTPIETDMERASAIVTSINAIEGLNVHAMWAMSDGTCVLLFTESSGYVLYLLYADEPALLEHANPSYDLTGL